MFRTTLDQVSSLPPYVWLIVLGGLLVAKFGFNTWTYHQSQKKDSEGAVPPEYPALVPIFGTLIPFIWNSRSFLDRATQYAGKLTSVKISVFYGASIHFLQDPETVKQLWRQSKLLSTLSMTIFAYKYLFGMPDKWLSVYREDDSGPFAKAYPRTSVAPEKRIHYIHHDGVNRALKGAGLAPTTQRFAKGLTAHADAFCTTNDWVEQDDLARFFKSTVGEAMIKSIFGPSLFKVGSSSFMDDLWTLNDALPRLSKCTPLFFMPKVKQARGRLHKAFQNWYAYARDNFTEAHIDEDGDGDPFWGSAWMRQRQAALTTFEGDDAIAASDLGVAWACVANIVPCAMMAVMHILQDPALLASVQQEIRRYCGDEPLCPADIKRLSNSPLLSSIYAETLRLHVRVFVVFAARDMDVLLGKWTLPKHGFGMVNAGLSQMDKDVWNTKNGAHPLNSFWAERFIVDPTDPTSGPLRPERRTTAVPDNGQGPYFSTTGLEGSWIPYGGGHMECPGRFLAKNAIIFTFATFISMYDIELLTNEVKPNPHHFGLGAAFPLNQIPFKLRRKAQV